MIKKIIYPLLFAVLLTLSFLLGMNYQRTVDTRRETEVVSPTPSADFCGGIAGILCPTGYECWLEGAYPDAGGTCVKSEESRDFQCPETDWVDCMPGPGRKNPLCSPKFLDWAKANCPGFQGGAY